jgi:hypothetical protein
MYCAGRGALVPAVAALLPAARRSAAAWAGDSSCNRPCSSALLALLFLALALNLWAFFEFSSFAFGNFRCRRKASSWMRS